MHDLVNEIGEACKVWGFFTVTNHGVPKDLVDRMVTVTKDFFHSPATSDEGETRTEEAFNMWPAFPNNMR